MAEKIRRTERFSARTRRARRCTACTSNPHGAVMRKDPARREIFRQNKACAQMYRLYFKSAQCRHAEKIRRAERFSVRTRRAGADVPPVLPIRTVPSCGKDPAHREIFRQNKACAQTYRVYFKPAQCRHAEKIRRAERFSVRTRRAGADVPCVLQARATQLWRKRSGAGEELLAGEQ